MLRLDREMFPEIGDYEFQQWLGDDEIRAIEYADYWNDEEEERGKEWYILDGDFSRMENYLKEAGFPQQLEEIVRVMKDRLERNLSGAGIDLAAGNLWAVPYLLNLGQIDKIYCLEYSRHRLLKLGPAVLKHYRVPRDKVVLVLGNFYKLKLDDDSLDFVFMSSSFHHADRPGELLAEINRVLKPAGVVIIIGEHIPPSIIKTYAIHFIKVIIATIVPTAIQRRVFRRTFQVDKLLPKGSELLPYDPMMGDRCHFQSEYRKMFREGGFKLAGHFAGSDESPYQSFLLVKST